MNIFHSIKSHWKRLIRFSLVVSFTYFDTSYSLCRVAIKCSSYRKWPTNLVMHFIMSKSLHSQRKPPKRIQQSHRHISPIHSIETTCLRYTTATSFICWARLLPYHMRAYMKTHRGSGSLAFGGHKHKSHLEKQRARRIGCVAICQSAMRESSFWIPPPPHAMPFI